MTRFHTLIGQDFCESLIANDYKAIIYSMDFRNVFVFIDKHFWIINQSEDNLTFSDGDRQAFGSNDQLGNRITTFFHINVSDQFFDSNSIKGSNKFGFYDEDKHGTNNSLGVLLFDNKTKTMQFVCQSGRVSEKDPCIRSHVIGEMSLEELRHSITAPLYPDGNIFVFQNKTERVSLDNTEVQPIFDRKVFMSATNIETIMEDKRQIQRLVINSIVFNPLTGLYNDFDSSRPIIGVLTFSKGSIIFFRRDSSIEYCYRIKCKHKEYHVFIDCTVNPSDKSFIKWIIIAAIATIIGVTMITVILIYKKKKRSPPQGMSQNGTSGSKVESGKSSTKAFTDLSGTSAMSSKDTQKKI